MESTKGPVVAVGAVALIVGLAIGFGVFKATDNKDSSSMSSTSSSSSMQSSGMSDKATALNTSLVNLGVEHMQLTAHAVDAALDGSSSADAYAAALTQNGKDIGAAVGSVYGNDAEATFNKVWQLHLNDFVKYAVAGSKGDTAGKTAALQDIDTNYTKPLAQYLAKANPNLPEATLESGLRDHIDMTAKMIDDHNSKNYSAEASELKMADQHISGLFSTLAGAIVKQYPSKF